MVMMQSPAAVVQAPPLPPTPPVDPNFLITQITPTVQGVLVGIALLMAFRWFLRSPIGEAIAEGIRLRRRRRHGLSDDPAEPGRVEGLQEQVRLLTSQVSELGERLDFAERLLAGQRERRVGAGQ
jgi:hypothetical protein